MELGTGVSQHMGQNWGLGSSWWRSLMTCVPAALSSLPSLGFWHSRKRSLYFDFYIRYWCVARCIGASFHVSVQPVSVSGRKPLGLAATAGPSQEQSRAPFCPQHPGCMYSPCGRETGPFSPCPVLHAPPASSHILYVPVLQCCGEVGRGLCCAGERDLS